MLLRDGFNIVDGSISSIIENILTLEIWKIFHTINRQFKICQIMCETIVPENEFKLKTYGNLRGKADCIIVCEEFVVVIDWKSRIDIDDSKLIYTKQLQYYMIGIQKDYPSKKVAGLLVSLTEMGEKCASFKKVDNLELEDFEQTIDIIFGNKTNMPGQWCEYCEVSITGPCKNRSDEDKIIKYSTAIMNNQLALPNGFIEIEVSTNLLEKHFKKFVLRVEKGLDVDFIFDNNSLDLNKSSDFQKLRGRGFFSNRHNIPVFKIVEACYL